jgi:hypothetical protein
VAALESFSNIVARVRRRLERLARSGEDYAVLGHSLGGLALRAALPGVHPAPLQLILLGTPNQSPRLARRLHRSWLYRALTGQSGQLLAQPEFFARLPPPDVPYTIIAGAAGRRGRWSLFGPDLNDGLVALEETRITPADDPLVFNARHTFMMNDTAICAAIAEALSRR